MENILEKKKLRNQTELFYHQYIPSDSGLEGPEGQGYHAKINV